MCKLRGTKRLNDPPKAKQADIDSAPAMRVARSLMTKMDKQRAEFERLAIAVRAARA